MALIVFLIGASMAFAETVLQAPGDTAVYQSPIDGARILFYMHRAEKAEVRSANDDFFKVRVRRSGKSYMGYVQKSDLRVNLDLEDKSSHEWSFGVNADFAYDVQSAKTIQDSDSVNYQTTNFNSYTPKGEIFAQYGVLDFWRLSLGAQMTNYSGTAMTSTIGAPSLAVKVGQTLVEATLKKGFQFFSSRHVYWGLGAELAKVTAVTITLNGTNLPTTSADQPVYIEGLAFVGGHWFLSPSFSIFTELQLSVVADESPVIYGAAAQVGLLYWL